MEKKIFSLEISETNKITKVFRFILGMLCVIIAVYWLIFNIQKSEFDWSTWVSSVFLIFFGTYMVWTSFGYGHNFIEFEKSRIRLKNNSFLPVREINSEEIDKIVIYPLKFIISLKSAKKVLTRFGISDIDKNESIKDELIRFAETHNISLELKNEI